MRFILEKIVGTKNDRDLKKLRPRVAHISSLEPLMAALQDDELTAKTSEFRERLERGESPEQLLPEAFAVVRETAKRRIGERPFDVQIMGAIVLHEGKIAEMKTGEGKTLTSTMPVYLNALAGRGVHVVTVNDYLAQRDAEWMGAIYKALGLAVGVTLDNMNIAQKQRAYQSDITYGTNSEFGFDYLRDNSSARHRDERVQRGLHYAIVDEVDSILVDEARTPHIISAPVADPTDYPRIARVVQRMKDGAHYEIDEKRSKRGTVSLTEEGVDLIEREFAVANLYDPENLDLLHGVTQALTAHALYKRDVDYVIHEGQVVIVDEFTGRMQPGRRYSDGLHQALEAKERVRIVHESQTVARTTFQNYFRMYEKLAGMTGTAATEAPEFHEIYGLDVVVIPTNLPMVRLDHPDQVYRDMPGKMDAVVEDIAENHRNGRPVLVGTISIEASEAYSRALTRQGIPHRVLNAKEHAKEAEIIAQAGHPYAVTIATNMAGRGVDIKLGEGVVGLGGLHVIGTERHDARRIDNQLRGRSGRQGDPGSSRFYLSLEDDLMRKFGSERIMKMMDRLGMERDIPIEHKMVTRAIAKSQERVEIQHFDMRKHVLKYDDVLERQRDTIYTLRNRILDGENLRDEVMEMVEEAIEAKVAKFLPDGNGETNDVEGLMEWAIRHCGIHAGDGPAQPSADEWRETLIKEFHRAYDAREAEIGPDIMRHVERLVLLDRIDHHWTEHLQNIDYLQEGIGFRGYGGRDPVVEFQQEGFDLFTAMLHRIHEDVAQFILRVQIEWASPVAAESPQGARRPAERGRAAGSPPTTRRFQRAAQAAAAQVPKVGRNQPCPCGSGKKYKFCHGRLAARDGGFA
jgi:preprotein translocase subunit SecA